MINPYIKLSNEELLQKWRKDQDKKVEHVLLERYHNIILALALRKTGNYNNAMDLTQQTFANALEKKEWHWDDLLHYLIGAVNNNHLSERRNHNRREVLLPKDRSKDVSERVDIPSTSKMSHQPFNESTKDKIANKIADGLSDTEIAEQLNLPLKKVHAYRKEICKDLNQKYKLKKYGPDYFLIKKKEQKKLDNQNKKNLGNKEDRSGERV